MAEYRMTPARAAALKKAQAASAQKRRRNGNRSRTTRLVNRGTVGLAVVGTAVAAHSVYSNFYSQEAINERIIGKHVELAQFHHEQLNRLRARAFPTSVMTEPDFNPTKARLEAIAILNQRKKKRKA